MRALMVQGTSSWAGKSLIATALCRHFARQGVRVAPYKAQNMSNNARVVAGGEIGVAQYLQARAAGVEPDVRMNPVLIKPEGSTRSQVVLHGEVDAEISSLPWRERAQYLWPPAAESLASLLEEFELVVLEGAGSPAEINLADIDAANLKAARAADAAVLLVTDIDRGGAFAHLYGTWALLGDGDRQRIAGFLLNKFRGDPGLLAPAPERLTELTGMPMVGVVPWLRHGLPDEDGAAHPVSATPGGPRIAVVRYPMASNLDEFKLMEQVAEVRWAAAPADLEAADLVVLPGSKEVIGDLAWLRERGLDRTIQALAQRGGAVVGICGGLQMLGERLGSGEAGLGLLPLRTRYEPAKLTRRVEARFESGLGARWAPIAGLAFDGYEIRSGQTEAVGAVQEALPDGRGWWRGSVLGVTIHGLFESPDLLAALLGAAPEQSLDEALDELADGVMAALDQDRIEAIVAG